LREGKTATELAAICAIRSRTLKHPNAVWVGLLLVWSFSLFSFGGVSPWASALAATLVWMTVFAQGSGSGRRAAFFVMAAVALYALPLPTGLLSWTTPEAAAIWDSHGFGWGRLAVETELFAVESIKLAAGIAAGCAACHAVRSGAGPGFLCWGAVLVSAFVSAYGWTAYLLGDESLLFWGSRLDTRSVTGTFINRNHFAGLLEMALPLSLALLWVRLRRGGGSGAALGTAALALLFLACLLLSRSRAGLASACVGIFVFCFAIGRSRIWIAVGALFLLAAIVAGLGPLRSRIDPADLALRESRLQAWEGAAVMIACHPVTGVGPGCFGAAFPSLKAEGVSVDFRHPHNEYLAVAAEFGIPALLLGVALAVLWFRRVWPAARTEGRGDRAYLAAALAGVAALLTHALFDFNLRVPSNLLLFSMLVGAAWGAVRPERQPASPFARAAVLPLILVAAVSLFGEIFEWTLPWTVGRRVDSSPGREGLRSAVGRAPLDYRIHFAEALLCREPSEEEELHRELDAARRLGPHQKDLRYKEGLLWLDRWRRSRLDPDRIRAVLAFRAAAASDPDGSLLRRIYGHLIATGARGWAETTPPRHVRLLGELFIQLQERPPFAAEILRLVPRDDRGAGDLEALGSRAVSVGWFPEAVELFREAISIRPTAAALSGCGEAWESMQEWNQARTCLRRAAALRPGDAELWTRLGRLELQLGLLPEAEQSARTGWTADPGRSAAIELLAQTLEQQGRSQEALDWIERALRNSALGRDGLIRLTRRLVDAGQFERAAFHLRAYSANRPSDAEAAELLKRCGERR
jgi:O-antigen ligase